MYRAAERNPTQRYNFIKISGITAEAQVDGKYCLDIESTYAHR